MDTQKYNRKVMLLCSTCGHKDFEYDSADGPLRCTHCDRVFDREELIRENGEVIEAEIEELKGEVVKELRDRLQAAFRGSKNIRLK